MRLNSLAIALGVIISGGSIVTAQTTGVATMATPPEPGEPHTHTHATPAVSAPTLSSFLENVPKPAGPDIDSFYAPVPPDLDASVRFLAMDNFTSAAAALQTEYQKYPDGKDRARVAMWLGINYGMQAISYPSSGWENGTSATTFLKEAMRIDPTVFEAPDVARVLAEMVAHGWASEDPATALQRAEQKAEETRRPLDFYFAGVISRRLAQRAWGYSDTTEQDKKTLSLFAKSIARDPSRYESWSAYLPALMPAGMHDLATSEAKRMYQHFGNLRTPLFGDQGPAVMSMSVSSYRTMEEDAALLKAVTDKWPDAPMPPFETAMRAIETTIPLAMELFPKLIQRFESGDIKPLPREAGYYPSALYKYAFLLSTVDQTTESLTYFHKVRDLSPSYAEVNMNIAVLLAQQSDKLTTGPAKLALLEESLKYAAKQEKLDYKGKSALKANEMARRLRSIIYRLKQAIETK